MNKSITLTIGRERFNVLKLIGTERISRPYKFIIDILTNGNILDPNNYILASATLNLKKRLIAGIVTATQETLLDMNGKTRATFTLEPQLALADLSQDVRVILKQSVPEIIHSILIKLGYQKQQLKFHLSNSHFTKPYHMQVPGETDLEFMHRLLAKAGIFYWLDTNSEIIHFSDNNDFSSYIKSSLSDICYKSNRNVIAKSINANLQFGCSIKLKNDAYLIQRIFHYFAQNIEQQGENILYHNKLLLIPRRKTPIRITMPKYPQFAAAFQAHIESNGNYAQLDENGKYRLRQRFDLSGSANTLASPPLARLSPYNGWHMPLRYGAEVLIGALNGDPDCPIVIGSMPNTEQISPVTSRNKSQNKIQTASDNQLLMDDAIGKQKIQLTTFGQQNLLELNAHQNQPHITLSTNQGLIEWNANQICSIQSGDTIRENICNNRIQIAEQNHCTQTKNQDIHYQSGADQQFHANNNLYLQSANNIEFTANNALNIQSKNTASITINGQYANYSIQNGNLFIESAKGINIVGSGNGDIEFIQNNAGYKITSSGVVKLYGKVITGITELKGQVNYLNTSPMPSALPVPDLISPQIIENLDIANHQSTTDSQTCKFFDEYNRQFESFFKSLNDLQWNINGQVKNKLKLPTDKNENITIKIISK